MFCQLFNPLSTQCSTFIGFNVGPVADGTYDVGSTDEIGLKVLRHVAQLFTQDRFQGYSDALQNNTLYPVENITVPFTVAYSDVDTTCPYTLQTSTLNRVGSTITSQLFAGAGHTDLVGNNSVTAMTFLKNALDSYSTETIEDGNCSSFNW